jgi:glutamyl/glutaminyl-tRNA synthetase
VEGILFPVTVEMEEEVTIDEHQKKLITAICDAFEGCGSFSHDTVEAALREALTAQEAKLKDVAKAIRMSTTGRPVGPGLFDLLSVIGSDLVVARLRALVEDGGTGLRGEN